jgi:hypothetical protein
VAVGVSETVPDEVIERVALGETCLKLGRVASAAEFMAKHSIVKGINVAVTYDRALSSRSVALTVTFRIVESKLDPKETKRYLLARAKALTKYLGIVKQWLERDGIECELSWQILANPIPNLTHVMVSAVFRITRIDLDKLLRKGNVRKLVIYETTKFVGGERARLIKLLERLAEEELERERERGAGDTHLEEAAGETGEGGAEGVLHGAGAGGEGAAEVPGAAGGGGAGEGWIRVIDAVAEFEVPLALLDSLIREGRIEGRVGPDGFWYVRLEDVMKIREVMGKGGRVRGGGA